MRCLHLQRSVRQLLVEFDFRISIKFISEYLLASSTTERMFVRIVVGDGRSMRITALRFMGAECIYGQRQKTNGQEYDAVFFHGSAPWLIVGLCATQLVRSIRRLI